MSTASSSSSTEVLTTSVPGSSSAAGLSAVVPTSAAVGTLSVENLRALIREEIGSANGIPSSAASSASPAMAG